MTPRLLRSFLADRAGGTAVEYGLLVSLIAIGLLGGLSAFSDSLGSMLTMLAGKVESP